MGVSRNKDLTKSRSAMAAQRPLSPTAPSEAAPNTPRTTVASSVPPARKKEEEKLRGTSTPSSVTPTSTTNNNTSRTKIVSSASEAKDDKKNVETLLLGMGNMSLSEDNELNKQFKNLSVKDSKKEKEQSEDSDLLSRGPDRICTKGTSRTSPYVLYEQYIVSSDKHGGGTVLCPNISPPHQVINYPQDHHQEFYAANLQDSSQDSGIATNGNYINELNSDLENLIAELPEELHQLTESDLRILPPTGKSANYDSSLSDPLNIDKIILNPKDDKDIQQIKQELSREGGMDRQQAPKTPDSAYDSDECSIGSPSSVTSGVMRADREKVVTSTPYPHVVTQPTNLYTQTGFALASISQVSQAVPGQTGMFWFVPKPVMPPPQQPPQQSPPPPPPPPPPRPPVVQIVPQPQPQPLAPLSTPPPSPQGPRPILPGINIPADCNRCSEPAINRMRSVMVERTKDSAWALMFAYPETQFTDEDEDGNMFLSRVLSNWQKIKNAMEVFYALIQRLKEIINGNNQMAYKLLATPNKHGHTPLDIACRFLRSKPQTAVAVRYLADTMVEEGLAIGKEVDGNGNSLLHRLCAFGDEACYIMAELLSMKDQQGRSVFDVNQKNSEGKTPLHVAAQTHSDRTSCSVLAQLLMRSGADVSVKEGCAGNTVFHLVARESCDPNLLVTLLAKTSYASKVINEKNFNEDTPLHMVAANHAISPTKQRLAVQHLIDYGADPKLQNKSRKAPLSLVPAERKQDIKNVLYHKRQTIAQE